MAIITLPAAAAIKRVEWTYDTPAQVNRSGWTKRRQVVQQPGPSMWSATADLVVKVGEPNMLAVQAFLVELEGQIHSFRLAAVENAQLSGVHNVIIDTAGQSGRSLKLRGGVSGEVLRRGHKITVNGQMVMLMADATFGTDGKTTVTFKPSLRVSPIDGALVEVALPYVLVSLAGSQIGWSVEPGQIYQAKQLVLEEAI